MTRNVKSSTLNKSKALWHNNTSSSESDETLHTTDIKVGQQANFNVGGKVDLKAVQLDVGDTLTLKGVQGVKLQGDVSRDSQRTSADFKNETKVQKVNNQLLKTGHSKKEFDLETLHATQIKAGGDVIVQSEQALETYGAKVHAKGNVLTQVNNVKLDAVSTTDKSNVDDKARFFGGADEGLNRLVDQTLHGSALVAGGTVILEAKKGVNVRGSSIKAAEGALVNAGAGKANITHVNATDQSENRKRIGTIFNITKKLDHTQSTEQTAVGSTLHSDVDLVVMSDREINVLGSKILAARNVELTLTNGNVNIAAAKTNSQHTSNTFDIKPFAKVDADKGQLLDANAKVGVGLSFVKGSQTSHLTQHAGSDVQAGGNLKVSSQNNVNVHGSTIGAKGDVDVSAKNINVTAAQDTNATVSSKRVTDIGIGGSVSAGGGTPKVTVSAGITSGKTTVDSKAQTAKVSGVNGGNVNLTAENNIKHEGTKIQATGNVNQTAKQITNAAATDTVDATTVEHKGGISVELGASASKAVSLKGTIHGSGGTTVSNSTSQAGGSVQAGGDVNVVASGKVTDVGTKYDSNGTLNINAKDYVNTAAVSTNKHVSNKGGAEISVGASTSDFASIDLSIAGKMSYNHEKGNKSESTKGTLNGNNVVVNAANTASIAADVKAQNDVNITAVPTA
uniref:Hemagglutinin repeat-containing protein n=1 Tax=Conchiformibius kuhniae TaxID=211502 RepID=A0A8T9MVR4_9NEIS|nr:hemagglutinin repeat-containing protein [Conchiformibius kuhniae]